MSFWKKAITVKPRKCVQLLGLIGKFSQNPQRKETVPLLEDLFSLMFLKYSWKLTTTNRNEPTADWTRTFKSAPQRLIQLDCKKKCMDLKVTWDCFYRCFFFFPWGSTSNGTGIQLAAQTNAGCSCEPIESAEPLICEEVKAKGGGGKNAVEIRVSRSNSE